MRVETQLTATDLYLLETRLRGFVPEQVYDIHGHLVQAAHFESENREPFLADGDVWGLETYSAALQRWLPARRMGSLCFAYPFPICDTEAANPWVAEEMAADGPYSRSLYVALPHEDPRQVIRKIEEQRHIGIKPYPSFVARPDWQNAELEEYVPEWMWKICHEIQGVLMIHIVRERSIADASNQEALRRLTGAYPNCRVVLAHIARSFNYRHALDGLESIADLPNVWVDTSAITESPAFDRALDVLGPERFLFGSDYPMSDVRGKCTTTGTGTHWILEGQASSSAVLARDLTLIGIESLLCLREACERANLTSAQVQGIFRDNALKMLAPHLDAVNAETIAA